MVGAALRAGAEVSVTVRMDKKVKAGIAAIPDDGWTTISYPNAVFDEPTGRWISRAEVAEIDFVAFTSKKRADQVPGRLVVRRIPDLAPKTDKSQARMFQVWRHHAFFTTTPVEVADRGRRQDPPWPRDHRAAPRRPQGLRAGAPTVSEVQRQRRRLVLAVMAFNLSRAAGALGGPDLARATTGTIRRKLINVPALVASSARRLTLHLPRSWPWEHALTRLFTAISDPPLPVTA